MSLRLYQALLTLLEKVIISKEEFLTSIDSVILGDMLVIEGDGAKEQFRASS